MPYFMRLKPGPKKGTKKCYQVVNKQNRKFAKCTTKRRASKQLRLLRAIETGWKPTRTRRNR